MIHIMKIYTKKKSFLLPSINTVNQTGRWGNEILLYSVVLLGT